MSRYHGSTLLLAALTTPESMTALGVRDWETLIGAARQTRLLARLDSLASRQQLSDQLPAAVRNHLNSAAVIVRYHQRRALWELNRIQRVLDRADIPITVLKGGAYLMLDLGLSRGREMRDIDLLIRHSDLQRAEQILFANGWGAIKLDDYDQQYYRQWMHELPPIRHRRRVTEVDIHHTIVPLTSRLHPDADKLLEQVQTVQPAGLQVLAPPDLLLHCAVHLFYDGALDRDFRDLLDLHELFQHFGPQSGFWDALTTRAPELGLERPLYYAMRYSRRILHTDIPADAIAMANSGSPALPIRMVMDRLVPRALLPSNPKHATPITNFSRWLLYLRSHWLRMPPLMLARHLIHKGVTSNIHRRSRIFE